MILYTLVFLHVSFTSLQKDVFELHHASFLPTFSTSIVRIISYATII